MISLKIMKLFIVTALILTSVFSYAESMNLSCQGTEQEWTSYGGNSKDKKITKSYSIKDKKYGLMVCSVWTERSIYCRGGVTSTYIGSNFTGGMSVELFLDRISGAVREITKDKGLMEVEKINPNPFGFERTIKEQEVFETRTEFYGTCEKAVKKF
jgi:hypothetical protein